MTAETTINWEDYITEFLRSRMTIKNYARYKGCSERSFKYQQRVIQYTLFSLINQG